jgi:hypothetical protein
LGFVAHGGNIGPDGAAEKIVFARQNRASGQIAYGGVQSAQPSIPDWCKTHVSEHLQWFAAVN